MLDMPNASLQDLKPILVSFDLCPYVQRAAITLAEKGVAFDRRTVDLANRPDWFKALSPLGKVPLLQVGDAVLFESAPIVEYLDEMHSPALHPADPLTRARHRAWMEVGSSILADIWGIETTPDKAAFEGHKQKMREKFTRLEAELGPEEGPEEEKGPYFAGGAFSLVDAVFAPAFRYFDVFDRLVDLGTFRDLTKVQAWRRALAKRPSVRGAVIPDYEVRLEAFLRRQKSHLVTLLPVPLS